MTQEYLILDDSEKKAIAEYKPDGIKQKLYSVEKGKCAYVQFSLEGDNEDCARKLSAVDEYVRSSFNVTVLQNDSSAYFNNKLYPLVGEFERKLRKFLYVVSAVNKDEEAAKNISDLESKDFGRIFTMLFVDQGFTSKVRDEVRDFKNEIFTKKHFLETITEIEENTVWDVLIGTDVVSTLRERYDDVRNIRNDIMHSQDVSVGKYTSGKKLFEKIIQELDEAIGNIDIIEKIAKKAPSFNIAFAAMMKTQKKWADISKSEILNKKTIENLQKTAMAAYSQSSALTEAVRQTQKLASLYTARPEWIQNQAKISQAMRSIFDSPAMQQIQKLATQMQNRTVPSELTALQEALSCYDDLGYRLRNMEELSEDSKIDGNEAHGGGQENEEDEDGIC